MAINLGISQVENEKTTAQAVNEQLKQNQSDNLKSNVASLSFGNMNGLMTANAGSEFTSAIAKTILECYKNISGANKPKVIILDKENTRFDFLAYSAIVVAMQYKKDVAYYIIQLEATGRKPLTADGVMKDIQSYQRQPNNNNPYIVYTTDDAIDAVVHGTIHEVLTETYGAGNNYISVEGTVLSHHALENTWSNVASLAYNACLVELQLSAGELNDLNIRQANTSTPNSKLKIDTAISRANSLDLLGKPVRTDWRLELNINSTSNRQQSLNAKNSRQTLTVTGGFVDAIPEEITQQYMGVPPVTNIRLRPHVVITTNSVANPTVNFMLLGLISSTIMVNKNMWLPALNAKENKSVGALNILTNLNNDPQGVPLDLVNKKYSAQDVYNVIGQMFTLSPMLSMDLENFGISSSYGSILAVAADETNPARLDAAREIINAANWLTNGVFNTSFDPNKIFAFSAVPVPVGIWEDKNGLRDIRDIDTAFVAANGSTDLLNKWVLSSLPKAITGLDPYITKVEVISALIPNAEITGKAFRVTFTDQFISELTKAAAAAGLDMSYEPEVRFNENVNINIMANYLNLGGITNVGGVARENSNINGINYSTTYSHMGYNRY